MKKKTLPDKTALQSFTFYDYYQISHPSIHCPTRLSGDNELTNQAETLRTSYHITIGSRDSKCFWNFAPYTWQRYTVIGEPKISSWKRYIFHYGIACGVNHIYSQTLTLLTTVMAWYYFVTPSNIKWFSKTLICEPIHYMTLFQTHPSYDERIVFNKKYL